MPTIRRYERQVALQPVSPLAASADAFGAGIGRAFAQAGQALGQTGGVVVNIHLEKELQRDKARVRDTLNRAIEQDREFMGAQYAKQGVDGVNVYDESKTYFDDSRRQWMGELETTQQQELFAAAYDSRMNSHLESAQSHQNRQIEAYDTATKKAFIANTTNDAVLMRRDPEFVAASLAEVVQTTRELYGKMGKEAADAAVLEATGAFHADIIEADIKDNPALAKQYFEKAVVQTQIPEKLKAVLKQKLDGADQRGREQERADFIMAASDDSQDRLRMARESGEDIRDGVVTRIKIRNAEEKVFQEQAKEKLLAEKTNEILDIKNLEAALNIADTVEDGKSRLNLVKLAKSLYGKDAIETDQARMLEARILIDRGEMPDIETLWRGYRPFASDSDWKQLENYFRSGGAAAGLKDSNVRGIYKSLTGKDATEKPELYNEIWNYVQDNLPEGRKPTDEEIRKLVGRSLTTGERKGGGWGYGEDMPLTEAVRKGHMDTWLPDVTDDEDRKIRKILKDNGKLINDRTIRLYKKHILMGLPLPARPLEVQ